MTRDYISGQAIAAMRVLGLNPDYFESAEDIGDAFDKIKRVAVEDWKSDREISLTMDEMRSMKNKILADLADAVLMGFISKENLEYEQVRAENLRPGMFISSDKHVSVLVHIGRKTDEVGSHYFNLTTIRSDANSVGTGGCTSCGNPGGQIYTASKGVADIIDPPPADNADEKENNK